MLKVCIVTPLFPGYEGDTQGISVRLLTEGLVKKGQTVSIITASKISKNGYRNAISIYYLPKIPQGTGRFIFMGLYGFCKVLHLYPKVDIIHYQWASFSPNFPAMIANGLKRKKKPCIVTVRGGGLRSGLESAIRFSLIKKMLKKVDRVVAISQGMYDIARMYDVPPENLIIIANGIDTSVFKPEADGLSIRKKFGIGSSPLVVSVGFEKIKGMEHLIRSIPKVLNEIPNAKFILIGIDGHRKNELQILARKLNVETSTIFVCRAPSHMMPKFFAAADVVAVNFCTITDKILPTEFGLVHLEAMGCGKPVVTSEAKGLIENGRTGFRVSTNIDDIASTIVRILKHKKLRVRIGRNARKLIEKHYSTEVMTERYLQLYNEVISTYK